MGVELRDCPKCGNRAAVETLDGLGGYERYYVRCIGCGYHGKPFPFAFHAVGNWNAGGGK